MDAAASYGLILRLARVRDEGPVKLAHADLVLRELLNHIRL
jgi:hypothetical protein